MTAKQESSRKNLGCRAKTLRSLMTRSNKEKRPKPWSAQGLSRSLMKVKFFPAATLTNVLTAKRDLNKLVMPIFTKERIQAIRSTFAAIVRRSSTNCHTWRTTSVFTLERNRLSVTCVENVLATIQPWNHIRKSTRVKRLINVASVKNLSISLEIWEHTSGFTRGNLSSCVPSVGNATTPEATLEDTLVTADFKPVAESG